MYARSPKTLTVVSNHQKIIGAVTWRLALVIQCVEKCVYVYMHPWTDLHTK